MDDLKRIIGATTKPVNVLVAGPYSKTSKADYAAMGAARLSLGSALARVTQAAVRDAAKAMFGSGDFSDLSKAMSSLAVDAMLKPS